MPNHVVNEIRLHGVTIERAAPLIRSDEIAVDFRVLLPLPLNFWPGSVGIKHEKAFPGVHLDAARATWGTKWNAYSIKDGGPRADGNDVLVSFETAWDPPRGWVVALFNTLRCDITHYWQDEGSEKVMVDRYNACFDANLGPEWSCSEVEHGSLDHRRLMKLQWGVETLKELGQ